eukprot:scaffold19462_cov28-Tisochrysis_lutea.AAC.1
MEQAHAVKSSDWGEMPASRACSKRLSTDTASVFCSLTRAVYVPSSHSIPSSAIRARMGDTRVDSVEEPGGLRLGTGLIGALAQHAAPAADRHVHAGGHSLSERVPCLPPMPPPASCCRKVQQPARSWPNAQLPHVHPCIKRVFVAPMPPEAPK